MHQSVHLVELEKPKSSKITKVGSTILLKTIFSANFVKASDAHYSINKKQSMILLSTNTTNNTTNTTNSAKLVTLYINIVKSLNINQITMVFFKYLEQYTLTHKTLINNCTFTSFVGVDRTLLFSC